MFQQATAKNIFFLFAAYSFSLPSHIVSLTFATQAYGICRLRPLPFCRYQHFPEKTRSKKIFEYVKRVGRYYEPSVSRISI
ncbi:MAG: hypothetical protein AVDCRST_MAG96-2222 [uncultured Segetibacter sp.]|uniref:Uncharacterized protein n=1 Tax=uncultured Segetibacter sp. TaxID=481133 RepID=A0A6J4SUQ0_9BACT|nr:MAG: hypothetical protein AVDCRST_MAG96-2222 [uncultured Segetibacter sp.]